MMMRVVGLSLSVRVYDSPPYTSPPQASSHVHLHSFRVRLTRPSLRQAFLTLSCQHFVVSV